MTFGAGGTPLPAQAAAWPTPKVASVRTSRKAMTENAQWSAPAIEQIIELAEGTVPREFGSVEHLTPMARRIYESHGLPRPMMPKAGEPTSTAGRVLNPQFVEALMGWPIGWTDFGSWGME